eukprot:Em0015g82a
MDAAELLRLYEAAFKDNKHAIIKALHGRLFVYLEGFNALTSDERKRIEERDLSVEKRAAEIFKVVREKHDLSAYIGLSRTIAYGTSEKSARELFPLVANEWWLQILHSNTKRDDSVPSEPEESTLSLLWLTTARCERDVVVTTLTDWEMCLIEEKIIEGCHCVTYAPSKPHFPLEKTRLTLVLIEDKLSFFKKDAAVNSLLAHFRPSIVALTGTCTPGDNAHVKPGDTVVVTNESTPWHGELEHMSEIWRLQDEMQQSVRFQTAHYYSKAKQRELFTLQRWGSQNIRIGRRQPLLQLPPMWPKH